MVARVSTIGDARVGGGGLRHCGQNLLDHIQILTLQLICMDALINNVKGLNPHSFKAILFLRGARNQGLFEKAGFLSVTLILT